MFKLLKNRIIGLIIRIKEFLLKEEFEEYLVTSEGVGSLICDSSVIGKLYIIDQDEGLIGIVLETYNGDYQKTIIEDVDEVIEVLDLIITNSEELLNGKGSCEDLNFYATDEKEKELKMIRDESISILRKINKIYKKGER